MVLRMKPDKAATCQAVNTVGFAYSAYISQIQRFLQKFLKFLMKLLIFVNKVLSCTHIQYGSNRKASTAALTLVWPSGFFDSFQGKVT